MISWNDSAMKCQHQRRRCRLHAIPEKKPVTRDWLVSMWPSSILRCKGLGLKYLEARHAIFLRLDTSKRYGKQSRLQALFRMQYFVFVHRQKQSQKEATTLGQLRRWYKDGWHFPDRLRDRVPNSSLIHNSSGVHRLFK